MSWPSQSSNSHLASPADLLQFYCPLTDTVPLLLVGLSKVKSRVPPHVRELLHKIACSKSQRKQYMLFVHFASTYIYSIHNLYIIVYMYFTDVYIYIYQTCYFWIAFPLGGLPPYLVVPSKQNRNHHNVHPLLPIFQAKVPETSRQTAAARARRSYGTSPHHRQCQWDAQHGAARFLSWGVPWVIHPIGILTQWVYKSLWMIYAWSYTIWPYSEMVVDVFDDVKLVFVWHQREIWSHPAIWHTSCVDFLRIGL